ncbi:MAG TPA: helicase-related protein [Allocoleopsis sp.]
MDNKKTLSKKYSKKSKKNFSKKNSMKKSNIKLLKHQRYTIEYIVAKCKKQHGLIVNHYMGTGKTITGLTFFKNYPDTYKKVLICPRNTKNLWILESRSFDVKNLIIVTFDELRLYKENESYYQELFLDSICVIDESHNLYDFLMNIDTSLPVFFQKKEKKEQRKDKSPLLSFIDAMQSTRKILLLTGTMITKGNITGLADIRWLINIAAGKTLVPYDISQFIDRYKYISSLDMAFFKIIYPFIKKNPFGVIPKDIAKKINIDASNAVEFVFKIASSKIISNIMTNKSKINALQNIKVKDLTKVEELVKLKNQIKQDYVSLLKILFFIILYNIVPLLFNYIKTTYEEYYGYATLDLKKLNRDNIGTYISYFNYKNEQNNVDYPSYSEYTRRVNYTRDQLELLVKMLGIPENLTDEEYVLLDIHSSVREAEFYKDYNSVLGYYNNNGRIIGNLYNNPNKFLQILDIYKTSKKNTVVYSNFDKHGIRLFSRFLTDNKVKHHILDHSLTPEKQKKILENFKYGKGKMLLLHPDFYEGISISGCRHLHILEPILQYFKKEQLITRTVRYLSHSHLKPEERNIQVYNWSCTLYYDLNKLLHSKKFISQFFKSEKQDRPILEIFNMLIPQMSPDDKLMKKINTIDNFYKDFDSKVFKISVEQSKQSLPIECCIWTPDDSCSVEMKSCVST